LLRTRANAHDQQKDEGQTSKQTSILAKISPHGNSNQPHGKTNFA
jgi:hypothetical protein